MRDANSVGHLSKLNTPSLIMTKTSGFGSVVSNRSTNLFENRGDSIELSILNNRWSEMARFTFLAVNDTLVMCFFLRLLTS
jgi:hypothetical protein